MALRLRPVKPLDYPFLYTLLAEKEPYQNISHKEMPTYEEHEKFNRKKPYKLDKIIQLDGKQVGRIYLTRHNEVGMALLKEYQGQGLGGRALEMFLVNRKNVLANISPLNTGSQQFFQKHGFKLIQYTYKRD